MSELKKLIGERIRNIRINKNLTLHQLSQLTGQQASYLTEVELGKRNLSVDSLEKIMNALNIKPGELFDFREIDPDSQEFETRAILEVHYQFLLEKKSDDVRMIHRITKEIFASIEGANKSSN
ncbi:helix-turn-helix domain-containing protein [Paenibacillus naphthalenovorans]|uniref:helix-turn-helix domain-containing protein n=1 Tax=Paenibacillus naphthalenovorans TaxID=162209 RepID=UPI0008800A1F|nr:helix-turn-helix transcriptional regulator [Paenibacillus naphthalenovorans]SDJ44745.1 Helix-turn-helix [Paenibacillus naphthalenovorans]